MRLLHLLKGSVVQNRESFGGCTAWSKVENARKKQCYHLGKNRLRGKLPGRGQCESTDVALPAARKNRPRELLICAGPKPLHARQHALTPAGTCNDHLEAAIFACPRLSCDWRGKKGKLKSEACVGGSTPCCPRRSGLGSSGDDRGGAQVGVLLEITLEQFRQAKRRLLELAFGLPVHFPRFQRLESLERDILDPRRRHLQTEDGHFLPLHVFQGAVVDGVDELPCVLQAHAAASTVSPASPTRIHQVRRCSALLELRSQHLRVNVGVPH
mmetsp:Transcript_41481/g.115788  ORF Transcript_41481/g.115788 Transcript_41481/m.115788 type:complete len:270 (-) Transcript_41481:630-1439(-)